MTTTPPPPAKPAGFVDAFTSLARLPGAFWIVVGAFVVEAMAYFGMLTLMTTYLSTDLGWSDQWSGMAVSLFTMLVTLFMLGVGSYAESFGLRRAILFALLISTLGRALYSGAANLTDGTLIAIAIIGSLVVVASGSGILQPVCYSGVKQYTDRRTSSMGYGLIYAVMNLGIVVIGALSSWIRPAVQRMKDANDVVGEGGPVIASLAGLTGSGVQAVNWVCTGITGFTLVMFLLFMSRKAEGVKLRPDHAEEMRKADQSPLGTRLRRYFVEGPFTNPRFIFFIFMLLPVRTLFAHQWLTMPQYILRAYPEGIADRMEWLVNWINPLIIFLGVPLATALTRHINVYRMMVIGSLVSALPTFLLCFGPNLGLLITYFVVFSIGEALWSARFLEYASELAPEGRVAQYMGLANVPWLLAKGTTGLYSGMLLATYVPGNTPQSELETGTLWFIYGCIAMLSPLGLWLARKWVMAGLHAGPTPSHR
jgi:proton-dependent oligopeptide transporter, POT family